MHSSVTYWEKWGGTELEAMARVVQAFNASQDTFEVILESAGDWSSSADVDGFLVANREGRGPDLIGLEIAEIAHLAASGALRPLPGPTSDRAEALLREDVAALGVWEGVRYAVAIVADLVTLYVDSAATRGTTLERGVPSSLAAFETAIQAMAGRGPIPFVPTYPGWWPEAWPLFFGGGWYDKRGRFTPDRAENLRAYEWIVGLRDRFSLRQFAGALCPFGTLSPDPFFAGEVALVLDGDWLVRRLNAQPGLEWAVAPFPTVDGRGGALLEADLVGVAAGARCPEGAVAFLNFLASAKPIEELALGQGKVSPLSSWSAGYVAAHPNPRLAELRAIWDRSHVFAPPVTPAWRSTREQIRQAFRGMWQEGVPPQAALAGLVVSDPPGQLRIGRMRSARPQHVVRRGPLVYDSGMPRDLSLRSSFDGVAELYEEARPGYPAALYDDVVSLSSIPRGGRILEIGCGPGTATAEFARRGYAIEGLELGSRMAALARANCGQYRDVAIHNVAFEEWPLEREAFDLVASASAFHWVAPEVGFPKAAAALRPGGSIALFWNRSPEYPRALRSALDEIYRAEAPELADNKPEDLEIVIQRPVDEIGASGLFGEVAVRRYPWSLPCTAERYAKLLQTYSDHLALRPDVRERLARRIEELVESLGGSIDRPYVTVLYVAQRR